jgi:hypothetical protein
MVLGVWERCNSDQNSLIDILPALKDGGAVRALTPDLKDGGRRALGRGIPPLG